jgi:hypothetical protein
VTGCAEPGRHRVALGAAGDAGKLDRDEQDEPRDEPGADRQVEGRQPHEHHSGGEREDESRSDRDGDRRTRRPAGPGDEQRRRERADAHERPLRERGQPAEPGRQREPGRGESEVQPRRQDVDVDPAGSEPRQRRSERDQGHERGLLAVPRGSRIAGCPGERLGDDAQSTSTGRVRAL